MLQHNQWPPDYCKESERRYKIIKSFTARPELWKPIRLYYRNNPIAFIEDFCVTYDPRLKPPASKIMPFILFPKQREFVQFLVDCIDQNEGGLVEKCRDMGATWLCCAMSIWMWLFQEGAAIGWGSRKEDLVDTIGDPSSIFEKMRMILRKLPVWLLPEGFDFKKHVAYMKILNPENNASINGESGDNIGRGGRSSIYFKDESAHYERPEKIEAALSENTDVQIDISSVHGTANVFYNRRMNGILWEAGKEIEKGKTRVFIFDWRDHPNKTQEWHDLKEARYESEGLAHLFAQEVERNYAAAVDKLIIEPAWVEAAIDAHIKLGFTDAGLRRAGQDVADEGKDKNALVIAYGVVVRYCQDWGGDAGDAAEVTVPLCAEHGVRELDYDSIGVGSGFKVGCNNLIRIGQVPPNLKITPWNAGAKVLNPTKRIIPGDDKSPRNEDFFGNLKAQGWWGLRVRFKKTYEAVKKGKVYPFDELISLDSKMKNLHQLKMELSQAVRKYDGAGRTIVDKKPDGTKSPNLGDAAVICFTPVRKATIFDIYE